MKILGVNKSSNYTTPTAYIVEISVEELAKVANKAGYRESGQFADLKPGTEYPIAEGYDFRRDIINAAEQMERAYAAFVKAVPTMQRFVALINQQAAASGEQAEG